MSNFPQMEYKHPMAIEEPKGRNALELLQNVYRDPTQPIERRIRCATQALPFETAKLTAIAMSSMSGEDFAARLERAVARSAKVKFIEARALPPAAEEG